jgi:hypothetical protein
VIFTAAIAVLLLLGASGKRREDKDSEGKE